MIILWVFGHVIHMYIYMCIYNVRLFTRIYTTPFCRFARTHLPHQRTIVSAAWACRGPQHFQWSHFYGGSCVQIRHNMGTANPAIWGQHTTRHVLSTRTIKSGGITYAPHATYSTHVLHTTHATHSTPLQRTAGRACWDCRGPRRFQWTCCGEGSCVCVGHGVGTNWHMESQRQSNRRFTFLNQFE